jgi:hypothetical protein
MKPPVSGMQGIYGSLCAEIVFILHICCFFPLYSIPVQMQRNITAVILGGNVVFKTQKSF